MISNLYQVTIQTSNTVNSIHLIIIAVEGIFMVAVITLYVWHMVQKVCTFQALPNSHKIWYCPTYNCE